MVSTLQMLRRPSLIQSNLWVKQAQGERQKGENSLKQRSGLTAEALKRENPTLQISEKQAKGPRRKKTA
jgi:hypothetical protein